MEHHVQKLKTSEMVSGEAIVSLNAAELDVEELESRLELAVAVPNADCWTNVCLIHG